jgi:hypothetical protein
MNNFQLYYLCEPDTDEVRYVGITKNGLKKRLSQHLKNPTNYFISKWFKELNINNKKPVIKLIKECETYEELLQSEINEIKKFRDLKIDLYNISDGGDINPMFGKTHTSESRNKISLTHKGKKMTEEQKLKRKVLLKQLWSNPEWSEKVRKKMRDNSKGENNPNWKGGISKQNCECNNKKSFGGNTCMSCRNISGEKNPFFGKTHTSETKAKIKQTLEKNGGFGGKNNPNFKYNITEDELHNLFIIQNKTVKEISLLYNCAINTINKKLRGFKIYKDKSNIYNLNKDNVLTYLNSGLNYVQIGNKYGCSNKIIHKFIKKHKLYVK